MRDGDPATGSALGDRQLAAVMRDAPTGMCVVDHADRLVDVNRAMCDLLGRSEVELRGAAWRDLTHPDDVDVGAVEIADLFAGKRDSFAVEKRYVRPGGEVRWALTTVSLVRDATGEPSHRIIQSVDVTDRKRWEAELQQTANMQAQVIDDLRQLEDAKGSFLTSISHELRTPLTVINGLAETLTRLPADSGTDVRGRLEAVLLANTRRMGALLDDLLHLDRLAAGTSMLDPTRMDVAAHVRGLVDGSPVRDRTSLDAPAQLMVSTDSTRLTLIVNHLLDNVAKYAPDGTVRLALAPLDGGGVRLEVTDQGPGIPPEQREAVFRPFHRLAVEHPQPGTGIGLSLVARFAAWHGGTASIIDSDSGTHVVVALPDLPLDTLQRRPQASASPGTETTPDVPNDATSEDAATRSGVAGRILVVDDDPQVRAMFRSALLYAGHDVIEAADAETAHAILAETTFDLTLLDVDLAGSSGLGIASLIRADPRHAATAIVFVSGDSAVEAKLAGLSAGGSDYLTKPVSLRELLGRVDAHLRDHVSWNGRLQSSLRERTQLADQILDLQGTSDLESLVTELRDILETHFPVDDLTLDGEAGASFAISGSTDRPTIRIPLAIGARPVGVLEVTTGPEHAQRAAAVVSDLAAHVALVAAEPLRDDLVSSDARDWLARLDGDDGLVTALQPVVAFRDGATVGYEALARFPDGQRPDLAIAAAWRQGIGVELEILAIRRHLKAATHLEQDTWLALNVSGQALLALPAELLAGAGRDIVFEITEQEPIDDYQRLREHITGLPRTRLAVDDTGAGYASLRHIYELRPSLIKLDRAWIAGCDTDPVRQTLIRGLVDFASSIEADVVAEGLERQAEVDMVRSLGVTFGQGFLLGRPFELGRDGPSQA